MCSSLVAGVGKKGQSQNLKRGKERMKRRQGSKRDQHLILAARMA